MRHAPQTVVEGWEADYRISGPDDDANTFVTPAAPAEPPHDDANRYSREGA